MCTGGLKERERWMKERDGECGGREKDFTMRHKGFISYILDTADHIHHQLDITFLSSIIGIDRSMIDRTHHSSNGIEYA